MRVSFLLLLLCSIVPGFALGQTFNFRHYQVEDGLSYNSVLCSMQDRNGFMWFGTRDGLNRFDGYNFKAYKYRAKEKNGLSNNYIYSLAQDNSGQIWVGTANGLFRFDPRYEKFTLISPTAGLSVVGIVVDHQQKVWFIAYGKLYSVENERQVRQAELVKDQGITAVALGLDDDLWLGTDIGTVIRLRRKNGSIQLFNAFKQSPHVTARRIENLWKDREGQIYIGTSNHGVKLLDAQTGNFRDILTYDTAHNDILARAFSQADQHHVWIGTESGIYVYDTRNGAVKNFRKSYHDPYSLSDNAVYTILHDHEGGMWVGTYFGGINYYHPANARFEKFFPRTTGSSLRGNLVREFCEDRTGALWIGTEDAGLNRYDISNNTFRNIAAAGNVGELSYNNVHGLLSIQDELWVGTYQHGLDVLDINTMKVKRHYSLGTGPHDLKDNFINVLFKSRAGEIFVGTQAGLFRYDHLKDSFRHIMDLGSSYISCVREDHVGRLWVGTFGKGVFLSSTTKDRWTHFEHHPDIAGSITSNVVTDVYEGSDQRVWFSTENGGLCEFNHSRNTFRPYQLPAELADKYLFTIIEDLQKRLWVTSSGGLIRLDLKHHTVRVFTKADGLLNDQFNYRSAFRDKHGRLYFGSSKGFVRHDPRIMSDQQHHPALYITDLQHTNATKNQRDSGITSKYHFPYTKQVTMGPGAATFNIDFAALSYTAPGTTTYQYKLEGIDREWTTLQVNRRVYYTQVPAGDYMFKVRAIVGDAQLKTPVRTLRITVEPPFYAGPFAITTYLLIGVTLIYAALMHLHKRTMNRNKQQIAYLENQKEREIYQAKIDFFTQVTHEIKTPLTLIKAPLEKVLLSEHIGQFKTELALVDQNTERLMQLVDQLLAFRRTEISGYKLNFNRTNVSAFLTNLCALFKEPAKKLNIDLNMDILPGPVIAYVDQDAFNKIISNLLSNAMKYGLSNIYVQLITLVDEEFSIIIKNDGPVIAKGMSQKIFEPFFRTDIHRDKPGTGIGLPLAKALAELHHGKLEYQAENDQLNAFRLTLPIHQAAEMNIGNEVVANDEALIERRNQEESTRPIILMVDDQPDIRGFVRDLLAVDNQVITAANAIQAREVLMQHTVHLIISDVMMPGINGFEFCKQLKNDIKYSHIPFILLTAKDTLSNKLEALDLGCDAFIEKPFSPAQLSAQVVNLLKNRTQLKNYYANSPLAHLDTIAHSKADQEFLKKLDMLIKDNFMTRGFEVEDLAAQMNMSRPTLYRKIKATTNLSPAELVKVTRLKRAAEMLVAGDHKIYEIAEQVGFASSSLLSRSFQKQFGLTPSEYAAGDKLPVI